VITSGGATAFLNLVLYLVERFAGHDHADLAAKVCWSMVTTPARARSSF